MGILLALIVTLSIALIILKLNKNRKAKKKYIEEMIDNIETHQIYSNPNQNFELRKQLAELQYKLDKML